MELSAAYARLLSDPYSVFIVLPDGEIVESDDVYRHLMNKTSGLLPLAIYPGSFNPLHDGHRCIFDNIAHAEAWGYKLFELSVSRWGKEPLDICDIESRLQQFRQYAPVLVTNASRFIEKCAVLRAFHAQVEWHIGVDTIRRMRDDYGEIGLAGLPGRFYVYDRKMGEQVEKYPLDFKHRPMNVFRSKYQNPEHLLDISSTKIRNSAILPENDLDLSTK